MSGLNPRVKGRLEMYLQREKPSAQLATIKSYRVLTSDDSEVLEEDVNQYLKAGWELVGGVQMGLSTSKGIYVYHFAQSLVKRICAGNQ